MANDRRGFMKRSRREKPRASGDPTVSEKLTSGTEYAEVSQDFDYKSDGLKVADYNPIWKRHSTWELVGIVLAIFGGFWALASGWGWKVTVEKDIESVERQGDEIKEEFIRNRERVGDLSNRLRGVELQSTENKIRIEVLSDSINADRAQKNVKTKEKEDDPD